MTSHLGKPQFFGAVQKLQFVFYINRNFYAVQKLYRN
jgi:hypothetical protein